MLLREMTSSALAHSIKRFARLAVVGLALAGLAACGGGGGGSSTPEETTPTTPRNTPTPLPDNSTPPPPEMTITPSGDTIAEAIDITGMETVEGELDSADDVDYYKIQVDEPTEVTLWVDSADVGFQVLDSEGNVLATSLQNSGGGSSSGLAAASSGTPQAVPLFGCALPGVNVACIRLMLAIGTHAVRIAARRNIPRATKYVLRQAARTGRVGIRELERFVTKNLEVGKPEDIVCSDFFAAEGGVPLSCSATLVTLNLGPYKVGLQAGATVRLSPSSTSECRGRAVPKKVRFELVASARIPPAEGLPEGVRESLGTVSNVSFFERTLIDNGPRLRPASPGLSLTVKEGYTVPIALNDHIGGGTLTFARDGSVPTGLEVRRTDANWWVTAQEGAMGGTITVAATDENNVCRTFPLEIMVIPATSLTVKPDYREGVSGTVAPGETYTSQYLGNYLIVAPAGEQLRFAREETRRIPIGEGWTHRIEDGKLVVSSTSDMTSGDEINITVSVTNTDGNDGVRLFFEVAVEEGQQQSPPPESGGGNVGVHCRSTDVFVVGTEHDYCQIHYNRSECSADIEEKVAQCPIPGESYSYTCRYRDSLAYIKGGDDAAAAFIRRGCEVLGGVFTPL